MNTENIHIYQIGPDTKELMLLSPAASEALSKECLETGGTLTPPLSFKELNEDAEYCKFFRDLYNTREITEHCLRSILEIRDINLY